MSFGCEPGRGNHAECCMWCGVEGLDPPGSHLAPPCVFTERVRRPSFGR